MAIIFMDSFDHYASGSDMIPKWSYRLTPSSGAGYIQPSAGNGRWGTNGLYWMVSNNISVLNKYIDPTQTLILGTAMKPTAIPGTNQLLYFMYDSTTHISVYFNNANQHYVVTRAGTALGTGTFTYSIGAWHYFEIKMFIDDTNGGIHTRVNGVDDIRLGCYASPTTTLDTRNASTAAINNFQLGLQTGAAYALYLDDFYMCDGNAPNNDFLGDTRIEYLAPSGVGSKTQFTPSSGSNYQNVDETTVDDNDYNSSSIPGRMDLFAMGNLAGNGLIRGVQTVVRAKKDDAGFRSVRPAFKFDASKKVTTGTQRAVGDTALYVPVQVLNTSPDTGSAWTIDEINALEYGYYVGGAEMFTVDAVIAGA